MPPTSSAASTAASAAAAGAAAKAAPLSRAVFAPRRWHERGAANHGWLKTFHTFSFASYHDPRFEDFGPLRVLNEDRVAPRTGFPTHPHSNAEIFSYVLSGELTHKDSLGNVEVLKRGEVQFTSAGSGIRHSEYNDHPSEAVHFLQIWYTPDQRNLPPKYYTHPQISDAAKRDVLLTLIRPASTFTAQELSLTGLLPAGRAIPAHAALVTRASLLSPRAKVTHQVGGETGEKEGERWVYVHLAMSSGWKDPDVYRAALRKAVQGNQSHKDRLAHAANFLEHVYGEAPDWSTTAKSQDGSEHATRKTEKQQARPQVTLTFAQSIDGFIAGPGKKQVALSAPESFVMTHAMRTMHDGILVGVGTLKSDDPQLNARLLNPLPSGEAPSLASLPRPIVLDTSLLTPLEAKILANHAAGTGARPLLVTSVGGAHAARAGWAERRAALTEAGAEILEVPSSATDAAQLDWKAVLAALDGAGIKRLMVEGGASVISSLLCAHSASSDEPLIDTLIVTISRQALGAGESYVAPTWLARTLLPGSVKTSRRGKARALLSKTPSAEPFGMDFVLAWGGGAPPSAAQATVRVGETVLEEGDGVFVRQARVGETLEIENLSARDAEIVLFDVKPEH